MSNLPEMKAPAGYIYRREKRDFGEYYDREELITCEDCKYWQNGHLCKQLSQYGSIETPPDFYCGFAEKRDFNG